MSSVPTLSEVSDVFNALGPPGTPLTTPEVAESFDCTDRTIYNKLETLVEDGTLETKKVGARGRVWWRPVERDRGAEQQTDETYRALFQSLDKAICVITFDFDEDGQPVDYRFVESNSAFEALTGLQDTEGKSVRELEPDSDAHIFDAYTTVAQTGESTRFITRFETLDDQWIDAHMYRVGEPDDHTVAVLFDDVTGEKRAVQEVYESKNRLDALMRATTDGIYRMSPDWSEIYQLAEDNFVSTDRPSTWQAYVPETDHARVKQAIDEAIETQSPFELEHRIRCADGTTGWTHSRAVPILEDGEIVEWFGTTTDITERKEQEREKDLLWRAIEKANSPLIMAEPGADDTPISYANEAFEQITGYSESEVIGQDCRFLQGESTREEPVRKLREAIDNQEQVTAELRNYRKDGTEFWNSVTITPVYDTDEELVRFLGTQEDITERKRQERKRKQVIDRVTDGIFELDADWQFTFVSDQAETLLDTSEAEILGRSIWDVFEAARDTPFEARYRAVMNTREPTSFTEYYPALDGWFDVQAYPNSDGGIAVYFRDVTERKEQEQARQRAEKRYQKLLEMAPVPVVAVDPTTGDILEANEAAGTLLDRPAADLIGENRASVHPAENRDGYDSIFTDTTERKETWRHLPDGSPTTIVTAGGDEVPVEITTKRIELEGDDVVFKMIQDVSDQFEYQRRIATLNDAIQELFNAEEGPETTRKAVETLADILDVSTVAFYAFGEDEWKLRPTVHASASDAPEQLAHLPPFEPGDGVEWDAFTSGQTAVVDDFRTRQTEYEFERALRSELAVPIGDWGVLIAGDARPERFDDWTVRLVETLGAVTEGALDRNEREQDLEDHKRELEKVESLNQRIRDIGHEIVHADTRGELEQAVCECLVTSDSIEFAWVGHTDLETKTVAPHAQAGAGKDYLDSVSLTLDEGTDTEPAVQATQSREVRHQSNTATSVRHSDWQKEAIKRGFRSVMSIPLIYKDAFYGVLTVYAGTTSGFPDSLRSVLRELCDLVAHTAATIEQKAALHTTQTMELEFEIRDDSTLFCRLATALGCDITITSIVARTEASALAFASVDHGTPEEVVHAAEQLDEIESATLMQRTNDTLVRFRLTELCIGAALSDRGFVVRRLVADGTRCQLALEVPKTGGSRQAIDLIMSEFTDAQLLAKRESDTALDTKNGAPTGVLESLTPRQREVVETAYRCGYFESPRRMSGTELAEMLEFSNSTFHEHIQRAEQTLFGELLHGVESSLDT